MEWTPRIGQAAEQAAGATPVFGITLQNFPPLERCQDFIQANLLFDHLLLGVLRHPQEAGCSLGFDPLKCCRPFGRITVAHPIPRVSRRPGPRKRRNW